MPPNTDKPADNPSQTAAEPPQDEDFLRGSEAIVEKLTRALDNPPDVGQSHRPESWDTFTKLAWRPAWAIRSRRGSLAPLIEWWRQRRAVSKR